MQVVTVERLLKLLQDQVDKGNGKKKILLSNDDEWNGYHEMYYEITEDVASNDMWGNRTILSLVSKGQFFAESYALLPNEPMLVDVCANEDCTIVFLDMKSVGSIDDNIRARFLANLLMITIRKNLHLSSRSFHTAPRQVRGRIMAYLNTVSVHDHSREFDIPFDRQQLADYLNVERSVLSNELSKMQRDRLIRCRKNHFEIL